MFLRKVFNDKHDITEAEAIAIAIATSTMKLGLWLKRVASAMAKTQESYVYY